MDLPKSPLPKKTLWKPEIFEKQWRFYCPHCHAPRQVPFHPNPHQLKNYLRIALCTLVFVVATFSWFEWKGLVAFVPFWALFETLYRLRARAQLVCRQCGFDPFLYLSDPKKARAEIELFWRKKFAEKGIPYPEKKSNPQSGQNPIPTPNVAD